MSLGCRSVYFRSARTVLCRVVPVVPRVDKSSSRPLVVLFSCKVYGVERGVQ